MMSWSLGGWPPGLDQGDANHVAAGHVLAQGVGGVVLLAHICGLRSVWWEGGLWDVSGREKVGFTGFVEEGNGHDGLEWKDIEMPS